MIDSVCVALAAITLAGARVDSTPGPTYSDPVFKFSIVAPAGWERASRGEALVVFQEPSGETPRRAPRSETNREFAARIQRELHGKVAAHFGARANITVAVRRTGAAGVQAFADSERKRSQGLKSCRIVGERAAGLAGEPAIVRTTRVMLLDGEVVAVREVFCVRGGIAYTFAVASSPSSFAHYSREFDQSLSTVKWIR